MEGPRHHYAALDGVRGFAALSVMIYHLGHWLGVPGLAVNSGLAVDLFFCLSGYVLSLSYGQRMTGPKALSTGQFFYRRLVRLMPVIIVATAIGAIYVMARGYLNGALIPHGALFLAVILALTNLPYLDAPHAIGGPQVFPLNGPQYSLFLELFINLFWWLTRRMDQRYLAPVLIVLCIPALYMYGLGGDIPGTFWIGLPRVGASFFIGVALYRFAPVVPPFLTRPYMFVLCMGGMVFLFFWPAEIPRGMVMIWIVLFSPLLVISGARVRLSPGLARLSLWGGEISYPLYALHYPVFCWVNGLFQAMTHKRMPGVEMPLIGILAVLVSFAVLKGIDEPVRAFLSRRRGHDGKPMVGPSYPVTGAAVSTPLRTER
ncbi:O-acetyltransferase OatA [Komagataeibacter saccharivorans]|uniref:O-acetyltransferase OatA n=2 Tax=Komagataeibacter saccharivorans TaxID=265959 RepID=A0A347WFQ6_9PROT|nr:acyltransferase [Komagataeibacter saccharivorans]AXY23699.1 O-acetyltransferase OatA [Komagataeibacter saccharivorans]